MSSSNDQEGGITLTAAAKATRITLTEGLTAPPALVAPLVIPIADRITEKVPVVVDKQAPVAPVSIATVDDAARKDGGKTTEDKAIPPAELEKAKQLAVDHTREEPGS